MKRFLISSIYVFLFFSAPVLATSATIRNDASGGDCTAIGTWEDATRTCTLAVDVNETITIADDGITLDGNGHTSNTNTAPVYYGFGVYMDRRTGVTIKNLVVTNAWAGILDSYGNNNIITGNVLDQNDIGLYIWRSDGTAFNSNTVSENGTGMLYYDSSNIKIYRNNFIENGQQVVCGSGMYGRCYGINNVFNLDAPVGGNYWSDFHTTSQGCDDGNGDGFCDSPYSGAYMGGTDNLPWSLQDGWKTCVEPPSGMIGWWPGDGNANDIEGGRNGAFTGSASYTSGKVGDAFSFDRQNYVNVADADVWTLGDGPFTIDLWVKFNSLSGRDPFISHDEGGGSFNKWTFWYDTYAAAYGHYKGYNGPALAFHINSPALGPIDPIAVPWQPITGQWYHVAVTRDGSTYAMYIDGVQVGTASDNTTIPDPSVPLMIGKAEAYGFDGQIDEVELFNRALSAVEIKTIYFAGSAGKCKPENRPPLANAGPDQTVEMTSCAGASVILDGSASSDPDGDTLTYTWTENGTIITTGVNPTVTLSYGTHTITLTVDDGKGGTASDDIVINVVDTTAPALNVSLNPSTLWPPNHKYVKVTPTVAVIDACVETTTVTLLSASSSEPDNGLGDGDTVNDIVINSDGTISLRAERSGTGNGRVYTITYQATDISGNTTAESATVVVPHNR